MSNVDVEPIAKVLTKDFDKFSKVDAINLLKDLRYQFKNRYKYLVGEWQNAHRAKSTRDGQFVAKEEVIDYLDR